MAPASRVNAAVTGRSKSSRRKRPKLGQNFLADGGAAARIVGALGDLSHRTVLEIGPGRGALTSLLATHAQRLIAIELDRVMPAQLRMKYAAAANVEIIEGDILAIDLGEVLGSAPGPLRRLRRAPAEKALVVGNIPYYITSDILLRLFSFHTLLESVVIMVQREVAERIAARTGSRDYGLLSATAQLYARVEKLFTLPPGAFSPPPKVHSTVLRLVIAPQIARLGIDEEQFIAFLKLSFGQKRKTLLNNLRSRYDEAAIRSALSAAGVRPDVRAEALPLVKAAAIFRKLSAEVG